MVIDFYELAKEVHKERIMQEKYMKLDRIVQIKYNIFCNWCRNNSFLPNELSFKKYLKSGDIFSNIDSYIIKRIYELFFGYSFIWNAQKQKWESTNK